MLLHPFAHVMMVMVMVVMMVMMVMLMMMMMFLLTPHISSGNDALVHK